MPNTKTPDIEAATAAFHAAIDDAVEAAAPSATPDATDNAKTRAATDGRRYDPLTHQWLSAPAPASTVPDTPRQE